MTPKEFVSWLYPIAERASDISPVFIVAQAALESGWGKSKIGNFNLFGVTRGSWQGNTILVTTTEYHSSNNIHYKAPEEVLSVTPIGKRYKYKVKRLFRDYSSMEEALADHLSILQKSHFVHAWPYRKSPEAFVKAIQSGSMKYATDPNYVTTMNAMLKTVRKYIG